MGGERTAAEWLALWRFNRRKHHRNPIQADISLRQLVGMGATLIVHTLGFVFCGTLLSFVYGLVSLVSFFLSIFWSWN